MALRRGNERSQERAFVRVPFASSNVAAFPIRDIDWRSSPASTASRKPAASIARVEHELGRSHDIGRRVSQRVGYGIR